MSSERIAATVIVYYPEDYVMDNIRSYYNHVEVLYVFDNTDSSSSFSQQLEGLDKVRYFHDGQNEGIAKRLNTAAELAIKDGFDWLLTMDQDTCFNEDAIDIYLSCVSSYPSKKTVAIFGTAYGKDARKSVRECTIVEEDNLITSGMLLSMEAYRSIGAFDENLFIDSVDHDYCIRAKIAGLHLIKFDNVFIQHNLGNEVVRSSIKTLFLVRKRKKIHPPIRCYYMYRNLLYLQKKFASIQGDLPERIGRIVKGNLKNSLLYGRQSLAVFQHLFLAYKDFKRNKMGKRF